MAITSGYFNSVNGDRKYNADQMSEYFEGIINEGVCQHIDGGLAVTAGTGLSVNVAAGKAFIGKKWIRNDASLTLTISAASASYARIDAVVLRRNNTTRTCQIVVKSGTPAASPAAPTMTRNSTTYEMALAYVNVAANATSVTVTDKRADTTVCGWATVAESVPGEIDAQLNAMKTGFDGVVYPSPAAMVTGEDQKLKEDIGDVYKSIDRNDAVVIAEFVKDKTITTSGSTVDITAEVDNPGWKYAVISCSAGDCFTIKGAAGVSPRLWCFIDSAGNSLAVSAEYANLNYRIICAPTNSANLVVNINPSTSADAFVVKGKTNYDKFGDIGKDLVEVKDAFDMSGNLFDKYDPDTLIGKYYNETTLVYNSNLGQSGFIPAEVGSYYSSSNTGSYVQLYNAQKEFVTKIPSSEYSANNCVLIPTDIAYARFIFTVAEMEEFQIWKSDNSGNVYTNVGEGITQSEIGQSGINLKFIGGVIRNSGSGWGLINYSNHKPLNIASVEVNNTGDIVLTFSFTARNVISLVVTPDETFASQYVIGSSVALDTATLSVYNLLTGVKVNANDIVSGTGNFWIFGVADVANS